MSGGFNLLNSSERSDYGVIATLENESGTVALAKEFPGSVIDAMRALADYCDRHRMMVLSVSSPASIYGDIRGRQQTQKRRHTQRVNMMEVNLLGKIGRLDLLHPRVRPPVRG